MVGRRRYLLDVERILFVFLSAFSLCLCLELLLIWNPYNLLHDRPISNGRQGQGPSTIQEHKDNNQETGSKYMPHLLHLIHLLYHIDCQCRRKCCLFGLSALFHYLQHLHLQVLEVE